MSDGVSYFHFGNNSDARKIVGGAGIAAACAMVLGIAFFLYYRFRRKTDEGVSCDSVIFLPEKNKVEPLEKDVPQPVSEKYKAGRLPDEECKRLAKALKLMILLQNYLNY